MSGLTPAERKEYEDRCERARTDFEMFARMTLPVKLARHQRRWIDLCQEIGDNPTGQRVCIIAPPGGGKSTLVAVGLLAWMIGRYPDKHYGLISFSSDPALDRSLAIRNLIEHSQIYRDIFPEVLPDFTAWDKSNFRVRRENLADLHPTLRATGATGAVVSYRLNGLVIDDPHDPKNVTTSHQREKVWTNYVDAIRTRLTTDAWQLCIGTRWSDDDFIGRLLKMKHKGEALWKPIHTPALDSRGRTYWPEEYPQEELEEKRYTHPANFAIQYMGDTTGGETQIIQRVGTYDEDPTPKFAKKRDLMVASGWDTAVKKKQENDFNVGYIGGLDQHGRVWVLDRVKGRWGVPELATKIEESWEKWEQFAVWIEDATVCTPAIDTLMESVPAVPTEPVSFSGDKTNHAHALAAWIHGGHVVFPRFAEWFEDCKYYLTHFPFVDHDDDPDALFVLCSKLLEQRHPAMYSQRRPGVRLEFR